MCVQLPLPPSQAVRSRSVVEQPAPAPPPAVRREERKVSAPEERRHYPVETGNQYQSRPLPAPMPAGFGGVGRAAAGAPHPLGDLLFFYTFYY